MTNEANHPIQLEQVLFTKVSVIAIQSHVPKEEKKSPPPENNIAIQKIEDLPNKFQATMQTKVNIEGDPEYPYIVDIECIGMLSQDGSLTEEEALKGIYITAHSVLYGAVRETIAWLTGRQPFGPLMLGLSVLKFKNPN